MGDVEKSKTENYFEASIEKCGLGLFNVFLVAALFPGVCATIFATTTLSYVMPVAECDLKLSNTDKGWLNAITYTGMIIGAVLWGFIADVYGRKPVLIIGHLLDVFWNVCASFSQTSTQLIAFKFMQGCTICGPYGVSVAYASEMHSKHHRPVVVMLIGVFVVLALLILPINVYFILPVHGSLTSEHFTLHNWNFLMFYTSIPSLISGIVYMFLPESPKFLLSRGRNEAALKIFQRIYALNMRKKAEDCPIPLSTEQTNQAEVDYSESRWRRALNTAKTGIKEFKILFSKQYVFMTILICFLFTLVSWILHSMRLWMPQIFFTMTKMSDEHVEDIGICTAIEYKKNYTASSQKPQQHCKSNYRSFLNNIIQQGTCFIGYVIMLFIVKFVSNKIISIFVLTAALALSIVLYFSNSATMVLVVSSFFFTFTGITSMTIISASVNIFPTQVRALIVTIILTCGRIGSSIGNVVVPIIINLGCSPLFIKIGIFLIASILMASFLPNKTKYDLQ